MSMGLFPIGLAAASMLLLQGCGGGVPSKFDCPSGCTLKVSCKDEMQTLFAPDTSDDRCEGWTEGRLSGCDAFSKFWGDSTNDERKCIELDYCCRLSGLNNTDSGACDGQKARCTRTTDKLKTSAKEIIEVV